MVTDSAGDGERFERIVPITLAAATACATVDAGANRRGAWWLPAALVGLMLMLLAVLLWLPKAVSDATPSLVPNVARSAAKPADPVPSGVESLVPSVASPADVETTVDQRHYAEALAAQQRARNFEAVKVQINRAMAAESAGDMAAARAGFTRVLALDGANELARAGLARIAALSSNHAFAAQMSRGLAALARRDYPAAQQAFQAALKLRANAPEARDGLEQARLGLQSARVDTLRTTAQQAEAGEQWLAARDAYTAALAIDASLGFAQHGQQRAAQRAALAVRLQAHIDQAQRLSADSVRADARAVLADAALIAAPGPLLQGQVAQLSTLLERAATPVALNLRSDGKTQVTVYPIGDLGPFARHSLSLLPGHYTAIGRRPGYREVRVAFTVTAQGVADEPFIQCEEPI